MKKVEIKILGTFVSFIVLPLILNFVKNWVSTRELFINWRVLIDSFFVAIAYLRWIEIFSMKSKIIAILQSLAKLSFSLITLKLCFDLNLFFVVWLYVVLPFPLGKEHAKELNRTT